MWFKRTAWVAGTLVALWIVAWFCAPPLIRWQAQTRLSAQLGREVSLGTVGVTPWPLSVTLSDLAIAAAPSGGASEAGSSAPAGRPAPAAPALQVAKVHLRLDLWPLLRGVPVVQTLEIDAPRIRVARLSPGHYDVDDLIARLAPPANAPASEPARFALYNVQVRDAALSLDDRPAGRVQHIDALQLSLPFVSNLPDQVDVQVEPHLEFRLNGAQFVSRAQAEPFAPTRPGELHLSVSDLDLAPYLGYLPASLPVRVARAHVSSELGVRFAVAANGQPSVRVAGTLDTRDVALTDAVGAPLLGWQRLHLELRDVQPFARTVDLAALRVDALQLQTSRDASGTLNLLALGGQAPDPRGAAEPAKPPAATSDSGTAAPGWRIGLDALELGAAQVLWNDATVAPAAALQLDVVTLSAKALRWPAATPAALNFSATLRAQGHGTPVLAQFEGDGTATDHDARLTVRVNALSLAALAPYLSDLLAPSLEGRLSAQTHLDWSNALDAPRLQLAVDALTLDALQLHVDSTAAPQVPVALAHLAIDGAHADLLSHHLEIERIRLDRPALSIARAPDGQMNWHTWLRATRTPADAAPAGAASASPAWQVRLKSLELEGGDVAVSDEAVASGSKQRALRLALSGVRVAVQEVDWRGDHLAAQAPLQLAARIGAAPGAPARSIAALDFKGRIGMEPAQLVGRLSVERFPVALLAPYVANQLPFELLRADARYSGQLAVRLPPAGLQLNADGDIGVADVHLGPRRHSGAAASAAGAEELLSWDTLALQRVTVAVQPATKPRIEIGAATLTNFYARLIVTEQGRLNLQELTATSPEASAASPATEASASASEPGHGSARTELPVDIRVGATTLVNGRIDFTDHYVGPGYSAALTDLNGRLGAFDSASRDMATLELHGHAQGTALLDISGSINPVVKPLALDIQAKATDLDLAPLSPYSGKYAGYEIERGKLSMNVAYKIDPNGTLDASNQVVLNQLTFGHKVESKDATSLPVQLAVALLKDRNGVIDVNLPISGSLNDPKFSLGGIIVRVIVNLLTKAITAPFALLAGSGREDLSVVEFQSGTASMAPTAAGAIDTVAQALKDRPTLQMTLMGIADPASERSAIQEAEVWSELRAQQRREELLVAPPPASAPSAAAAPLDDAQRARMLAQLYKQTKLPNKPRNALGLAKEIPADEMMALLKAQVLVTDESARQLATQRAIAVRDALLAKGLPSERLFLAAPKLREPGGAETAWKPQVQLNLSTP